MPTKGQCLLYSAGEGIHEVTTWLSKQAVHDSRWQAGLDEEATERPGPCMYEEHNVIQGVVGYTHVWQY